MKGRTLEHRKGQQRRVWEFCGRLIMRGVVYVTLRAAGRGVGVAWEVGGRVTWRELHMGIE